MGGDELIREFFYEDNLSFQNTFLKNNEGNEDEN